MASDVLDPVTNPDLEDLEEGECSDDDGEEQVEEAEQAAEPQQQDVETEKAPHAMNDNGSNNSPDNFDHQDFEYEQVFQEDLVNEKNSASREPRESDRRSDHSGGESSRRDSERKHKKHKRHRSRSRDRDRDRVRDRDREKRHKKSKKRDREEYDPDDEEAKKKYMLKKMKALEGDMGLVPSDEEFDENDGKGPNSQPLEKKAHTRFCNLYMQGKCPRDSKDCLFSHDIEVPKVWELCKFYVYDRCAKRDKCLYLHKEFPCKYFHLGLDCGQNDADCKFSHSPLTPKLKSLLIKHVETAPKELLGDFPRMNNKDAIAAIMMTETAQNRLSGGGWLPPKNQDSDNSPDWEGMAGGGGGMADFEANPAMMMNMMAGMAAGTGKAEFASNRNMQQQMLQMMSMLREKIERQETAKQQPKPTLTNKPLDLMSIKVNEKTVQKTLQRIQAENRSSASPQMDDTDDMSAGILRSDSFGGQTNDDVKNGGSGGDSTPDITPPVSPSGEMGDDYGHIDDTKDYYSHRDDTYLSPGRRNSDDQMYIDEFGRDRGMHRPASQSGCSPGQNQSPLLGNQRRDSTEYSHRREENGSGNSSNRPSIDTKSPPHRALPTTGKVDPRKAKRAAREQQEAREREENDRLEKEKEQRMLDIDLGDVLGDLDLPPLSVSESSPQPPISSMPAPLISPRLPPPAPDLLISPRGSLGSTEALSQSEYSYGGGLPFKPHFVHAVARDIEASLHSHDPIPWVLHPVDVQHRDYSGVAFRHGISSTMLELDPRLRRYSSANGAGYSANATVMSVSPKSNAAATCQSPLARQHSLTPQSPTVASPPNTLPIVAQPKPVKVDPRLNRARKS